MTDGRGAEVVLDFVGESGAERDSWAMTRRAGSDFVIGYGGTVDIPTIDVISTERNVTTSAPVGCADAASSFPSPQ
jgi:NAD+-dependent secondary alcohol dehydrogenase Adh1